MSHQLHPWWVPFLLVKYDFGFLGSWEAGLGRVQDGVFDRWSFGERRATLSRFEAKFSSIHRSTSTSTTVSSEDGLTSFLRSQVSCVCVRRLSARQAQRLDRPAEQMSSKERKGVAQSC